MSLSEVIFFGNHGVYKSLSRRVLQLDRERSYELCPKMNCFKSIYDSNRWMSMICRKICDELHGYVLPNGCWRIVKVLKVLFAKYLVCVQIVQEENKSLTSFGMSG